MKKVLLISYSFPPVGGIGVQRNLKFVKYLPNFGWEPIVLTINPDYFLLQDNELLKDIPNGTKTFRTQCIKPKQRSLSWIKYTVKGNNKKSFSKLILNFVEKEFIIPDIWIGWLPFSIITGRNIIKSEKIDVILCSGPSFTSFLVGFVLSKIYKLPLILDYRDGWFFDANRKTSHSNFYKNFIDYHIERHILNHANAAIFVSKQLYDIYLTRFPGIKSKSYIISNGFDPDDLVVAKNKLITKKNTHLISHVGNCDYPARKPLVKKFLSALICILNLHPELMDIIKLRFVGIVPDDIRNEISKCKLKNITEIIDPVPHSKAIEYMLDSDALLLFSVLSPNNKAMLTGKLFEYLMVNKPILAFAPLDSAASHVIKEENASGCIIDCETHSKEKMLENVKSFIMKVIRNDFVINNNQSIKKYHRSELTGKLAEILEKLTAKY